MVVGGGFVGLSIALHLRWRGLSVRVLERDRFGDGTSSRGGGWVTAQGRNSTDHMRLALASQRYYPEFLDRIGDTCGFLRSGSLILVRTEEEFDARRRFLAQQHEAIPEFSGVEFLDRDQLRDVEPNISTDHVVGGTYRKIDGQIDPPSLVLGLAEAARRDGVALHQGAGVTALSRAGGCWRAKTAIGDFTADSVAITAGVWSPELGRLVGLTLPVSPIGGQMVTTPPREPHIRTAVAVWTPTRRLGEPACDMRQDWKGRIWLGTTNRLNSWDRSVLEADTLAIRAGIEQIFPRLRDAQLDHAWAGLRPFPHDELPVYGAVAEHERLFVSVPVAGIAETPIAGKAMANLIAGEPPDVSLGPFSPGRFPVAT